MPSPSNISLGNVSQGSRPKSHSGTLAFNETWLAFQHHIESGRNFRKQKDPLLSQTENQNAWPKLSKGLLDYDAAKIGSYSDDIDTLLVFAGLFSAILTAFSIEAYKLLQRDSAEASLQLLSQISQQLNSFSINQQFVNSSYQPPTSLAPYNPPHSAIVVNILWFLSLVLSLTTASLGMMVEQWLREYLSYDSTSPQAQARVRFYRHQGLRRWNVFEIAELLPSFLQVALGFFFVALSIFLRMSNPLLSNVVVAGIALWFSFYGLTVLGPMLSSSCPYKSPFLKSATHSLRHSIRRHLRALLRSRPLLHLLPSYLIPDPLLEDGNIQTSTTQDGLIWTQADNIFFDDQLVKDTIHICLSEVPGWDVVRCVRGVIDRRALRKEPGRLGNYGQDSVNLALIDCLIREIRTQVEGKVSLYWKPWMVESYELLTGCWKYCSPSIGQHHLSDFLLALISQDWEISGQILRYNTETSLAVLSFGLQEWQIHRQLSPARWSHILQHVMHSIQSLLSLGSVSEPPHDPKEATLGPVDPMSLDLAAVLRTLLYCLPCAPKSVRDTSEIPSIFESLGALIEDLLSLLRTNAEDITGSRFRDASTVDDWEFTLATYHVVSQEVRRNGTGHRVATSWFEMLKNLQSAAATRGS